jgi:chromosome segregation ATPase
MNKILLNEDALSASKASNLKDNLKLLLVSYDSLELSNTMVIDSINQQREKIKTLMTKVDKLNSKSKKDWRSIFKLKKEAETLRGIMKGYIHTIDSLNTLNINLSNTLTEKTNKLNTVSNENQKYKKQNKDLQSKVALGAVLQAGNVTVSAIRIRNSGTQSETTRAAKTNTIKACFTLLENKLSKAGDKNIYIKVVDPNQKTLVSKDPINIISSDGGNLELSSKRIVNYQNENMDLCVFHEIKEVLQPGSYKVEIYNDGYFIGESSFALR